MDKTEELRLKTNANLDKADHLLNKLYPSLEDPKLLLAAVENIFLGLSNSLGSLLNYELKFNRITLFKDDFQGKYDAYNNKVALRYGFDRSFSHLMIRLRDIIIKHKDSPVEFSRKNKFVICDEKYSSEILSHAKCLMYLDKAREFAKRVNEITGRDEHIFGYRTKIKKEERRRRY